MKPIALTLGDAAGVGPEVVAKALITGKSLPPLQLVGPRWVLERGAEVVGASVEELLSQNAVTLLEPEGCEAPDDFRFGEVSAACGFAAVRSVELAARQALTGDCRAMVTAPINKESVHAAGFTDDIGHQEILARVSGSAWTATMLMTPGLRVAHLSTHLSLIEAARYVRRPIIVDKVRLLSASLNAWGLASPRIAVAALNPHGGEGGLLGVEEVEEVAPAVADLQGEGINAIGPIPADSVFNRAINGEFDVVLALYHDQGHIAIKVHNFHDSTTATLGIPFVRTSVDHGTAFDIAGRGVANERSMIAAIGMAETLVSGSLGART